MKGEKEQLLSKLNAVMLHVNPTKVKANITQGISYKVEKIINN